MAVSEAEQRIANLESEVAALQRQMKGQRRETKRLEEWIDVLATPPHRKILFWLQGWRWYTLGRRNDN